MIHLICWFTNKGNNITFVKYICNWQYTEHFKGDKSGIHVKDLWISYAFLYIPAH